MDNSECPIPASMRRLLEVHRFWHRAMDGYGDPDEYLSDLNAAIQAARNTTFILQSEKARIPGFEPWYAPWQEAMRADPILKWLNEARVRIVHSGDLEATSKTTIRLEFDYNDAAREVAEDLEGNLTLSRTGVPVPPLARVQDFSSYLRDSGVPESLVREATVSFERRWEDAQLPGRELNAALAHVYAVLASVLISAHQQAGATCSHGYGCGGPTPDGALTTTVRPPGCMATTRHLRTRIVGADSGTESEAGLISEVEFDPNLRSQGALRYLDETGRPTVALDQSNARNIIDLLPVQIERAKAILRSGEDHGWFVIFFRGPKYLANRLLVAENAQQKRELAKMVAQLALEVDATGVLVVAEAWTSPSPFVDGEFTRPAEHPDKTEVLALTAATIGGVEVQALIPFSRPNGLGGAGDLRGNSDHSQRG
ncbi:hypothetical protein [Cryobacterium sp. TMT2-4]|uniref:hypothetical protein n=1 Tax=Cryobacterium sp. TMT2-4 TaxID=1259254 RepID=UPI00106C7BBD|nr:hypothetical protein [Cryobacterium sp. TMT2-4]TFC71606.1 hypothetical protein E3O54_00280 [Cryobacterium sp. TMT2-4]